MSTQKMSTQKVPLVVKVGGKALEQLDKLALLWQNLLNTHTDRPCVLVHGGGNLIDQWLAAFQQLTQKSAGQRITALNDMPVVAGALSGALNTQLVAAVNQQALQANQPAVAVGVGLGDASWCALIKDTSRGQVGIPAVAESDAAYLNHLLQGGYLPVVHSVGVLPDASLANVNADLAAASVAALLQADLLLLTDVDAILDHQGQPLRTLTASQAAELITSQIVRGGMQVKLEAALHAATLSRRSTAVAAWYSQVPLTALIDPEQAVLATHIVV